MILTRNKAIYSIYLYSTVLNCTALTRSTWYVQSYSLVADLQKTSSASPIVVWHHRAHVCCGCSIATTVCITYCDTSSVGACRHYLTMTDGKKKISPPFLSQLHDHVCFITILTAYFPVISAWHKLLSNVYISVVIQRLAYSKEGNQLCVIHSSEDGNSSSFRNFVFCSFLILGNRPSPNTQKSDPLHMTDMLHNLFTCLWPSCWFLLLSTSDSLNWINHQVRDLVLGASVPPKIILNWLGTQHTIAPLEHSDARMPSEWMGPHT
jgi:hypothetical protein